MGSVVVVASVKEVDGEWCGFGGAHGREGEGGCRPSKGDINSLPHPQQRTKIIPPIPHIHHPLKLLNPPAPTRILPQPPLQLIPLTHVHQTSDCAGVLLRRVGRDAAADEEGAFWI